MVKWSFFYYYYTIICYPKTDHLALLAILKIYIF